MGSVLVAEVFVSVLEFWVMGSVCWSYWVMGSVLVAEVFVSVLELLGYGECAGCRGICECVGVIGLWGVCWLQRHL